MDEEKVSFPWFSGDLDADTVQAYTRFIEALCKMSVNQKRVHAKEKEVENHMLQRGLSPAEGWLYLRGMAVIRKNKFTIYPSEWSEDFGSNIYDNSDTHLRSFMAHHRQNGSMDDPIPYGWTVGLNLPTLKTVRETIEMMKQEMVG